MDTRYQRLRFGGLNWGAAFFGWLVAAAIGNFLTAIISIIGARAAFRTTINLSHPSVVILFGTLLLLVAWIVAYYAGGYVAGRMSRFDGGRQGLGVWVFGIIITVVLALIAGVSSNFNLLPLINLPQIPFTGPALTLWSWLTLIAAFVLTALAAVSGAKVGETYHRRVDEAGLGNGASGYQTTHPNPNRTAPTFGEQIEHPASHHSPDDDQR